MKKTKNKTKNEKNIDKEIAAQLKKSLVKPQEKLGSEKLKESMLEEESESNSNDLEFHQFMRQSAPQEERAPVLERIAGSAPRPIFVGGIPQGTQANSKEESSDEFKYVSSGSETNEPKYVESSTQIYKEPERLRFEEAGRKRTGPWSETGREALFTQSAEARVESPTQERIQRVDRFDFENVGRRNPLEREEQKYEKYKPRTSK